METLRLVGDPKDIGDGVGFPLRTVSDNLPVLTADKKLLDKYTGKSIWKIGVSLCSGCGIGCIYCFTNRYKHFRPLIVQEIVEQVQLVISQPKSKPSDLDTVKVSFKQMGDPLLNQDNVVETIRQLHAEFPSFEYVVSTSAPDCDNGFFTSLQALQGNGLKIRLQFSCHTTSNNERIVLSSKLPMMCFEKIASVIDSWKGDLITLNFVILKNCEYDPEKIIRLFSPGKVFIKLNYLDYNPQVKKSGLIDDRKQNALLLQTVLKKNGFNCEFRH